MIVTDADGHDPLARRCPQPAARGRRCRAFAGTRWSEDAIGTNAMGTALAVDAPVQIHSAEHLVRTVHAWTCAAAPVHDPDTGSLDRGHRHHGPLHTAHPAMVQLVVGDRPAGGEPAAGAARDRRRAAAGPQHAAPGEPARRPGRAASPRPAGSSPASRTAGGRHACGSQPGVDRVRLDDGREMDVEPLAEGYLLHARAARRAGAAAPGACRCGSSATTPRCRSTARQSRSRCGPPSSSPRWRCTPTASPPSGWRCCSTATTATRRPCAARSSACARLIGTDVLRTRPYRLDATGHRLRHVSAGAAGRAQPAEALGRLPRASCSRAPDAPGRARAARRAERRDCRNPPCLAVHDDADLHAPVRRRTRWVPRTSRCTRTCWPCSPRDDPRTRRRRWRGRKRLLD